MNSPAPNSCRRKSMAILSRDSTSAQPPVSACALSRKPAYTPRSPTKELSEELRKTCTLNRNGTALIFAASAGEILDLRACCCSVAERGTPAFLPPQHSIYEERCLRRLLRRVTFPVRPVLVGGWQNTESSRSKAAAIPRSRSYPLL